HGNDHGTAAATATEADRGRRPVAGTGVGDGETRDLAASNGGRGRGGDEAARTVVAGDVAQGTVGVAQPGTGQMGKIGVLSAYASGHEYQAGEQAPGRRLQEGGEAFHDGGGLGRPATAGSGGQPGEKRMGPQGRSTSGVRLATSWVKVLTGTPGGGLSKLKSGRGAATMRMVTRRR